MREPEIWSPCFDGNYAISNCGNFKRLTAGRRTHPGRLLAKTKLKIGYYVVQPVINGVNKSHFVHRLVAEHFIGPCPESMEVNHIDGNKTNNHVRNLEYVTHEENMRHAFRTGLVDCPRTYGLQTINDIRRCRMEGLSFSKIAKKFGVSISFAYQCCDGNSGKGRPSESLIRTKQKPKLTASKVVEMRTLRAGGMSCVLLANRFNVSETQVSAICCGLKWKSVGGPVTRTKGIA